MSHNILKFEKPNEQDNTPPTPPMFNIPPLTLYTLIGITVIFGVQTYTQLIPDWLWYDLAFVPKRYLAWSSVWPWGVVSAFTHMFMHANLMHLAMNGLMFLAFGAATERLLGKRDAAILFILCGLIGAFSQFALMPSSPFPMIGASGALSGLFASVIMHLQRVGSMPKGRLGIWSIAIFWIGLSFFSALIGGEVGLGNIAWAAHAGGFLGGILIMRTLFRNH